MMGMQLPQWYLFPVLLMIGNLAVASVPWFIKKSCVLIKKKLTRHQWPRISTLFPSWMLSWASCGRMGRTTTRMVSKKHPAVICFVFTIPYFPFSFNRPVLIHSVCVCLSPMVFNTCTFACIHVHAHQLFEWEGQYWCHCSSRRWWRPWWWWKWKPSRPSGPSTFSRFSGRSQWGE